MHDHVDEQLQYDSTQTLTNGGSASGQNTAGSVYTTLSQLMSVVGRSRNARPTHWVMPEQVWSWIAGSTDANGQPIVHAHGPCPDGGDQAPSGIAGWLMGIPVVVDPQFPVSFGSTGPPSLNISKSGQYATQAGNGSYPVILCGKWDDCYLWSSPGTEMRVLSEVLSGSHMARIQAWSFHAATPVRFQAASAITISDPLSYTTGGVVKGKGVSYGVYTHYESNSPLAALGGY